MDEKRKFKRVPVNAIVLYQIQDHMAIVQKKLRRIGTPISVDISIGGLQVITNQKLPLNLNLKIDLSILPTKIPIEAIGKVAWIKKDRNPGQYKVGVKFTKFIDEAQRELIKTYIDLKD